MAEAHPEEATLIQQAQAGSLDAFNTLVLHYQNQVYSLAYRIMGDAASADDSTQEAFINAYRHISSYRGGSFKSWLMRITSNVCYDALRHLKRRPADYLDDLPGADFDDGPSLPSPSPSPEEVAQSEELNRIVFDCIQGLKPDQRLVLVLSDVQGYSYQEIAAQNGVELGTVKSRLSRARLAVRRCLQNFQELLPLEYRLMSDE